MQDRRGRGDSRRGGRESSDSRTPSSSYGGRGRGGYDQDNSRGRGGYDRSDSRGRGGYDRSESRGRGGYDQDNSRGRGGYDRSESRGRGGYDRSDSRGRGGYDRGDSRGRGGFDRGRGGYDRGRGGYGGQMRSQVTIDPKNIITSINPAEILPNEKVGSLGEMYGKDGVTVPIVGNYFQIQKLPNTNFCQYDVAFEPEVENDRVKNYLIRTAVSEYSKAFIFDGKSLFLPVRVDEEKINNTYEVIRRRPQEDSTHQKPKQPKSANEKVEEVKTDLENMNITKNQFKLTFKFVSSISSTSPILTTIYNLIIRKIFKSLKYKAIKRQYYDSNAKVVLDDLNLEIWPGFSMNISSFANHIFIAADVCHHVLMKTTVLDRLYTLFNPSDRNYIEVVNKDLLGQVVMTRYNGLTYRIDSIDFKRTVSDKFVLRNGQEITYIQYYRDHYGIKIQDAKQPLLVSLPRKKDIKAHPKKGDSKDDQDEVKPVHLIPELCLITGITADMRSDFRLMKSIAERTRVDPTERCKQLVDFIKNIRGNEEAYSHLKEWGLDIEPRLVSVPGRNLKAETITAGNGTIDYRGSDWTSKLRDMKIMSTPSLDDWLLIYSSRNKSLAVNFRDSLIDISRSASFRIESPRLVEIPNTNANTLRQAIKSNFNPNVKLIVNIIDSNKKESYDSIKIMCYKELGVSSQVVLAKTLMKQQSFSSVITKIALQVSCKLGGEPWYVKIPIKNYMIIGIDVCHDPSLLKNSYGGFVATLNQNYTRYFSRVTVNLKGMEMMDSLGKCLTEALVAYRKFNNCLPTGIVVFRDGVGDGQLELHTELELKSMNAILGQMSLAPGEVRPTLACLVVKKRISARLFAVGDNSVANPQAGTIVDQVFNRKKYPNFYLISQHVTQGSVVPTHFVITQNETKLSTDHLQRLTYKLCHTYFNWSGIIRVPAPVQYAHKLSYLASNSIRDECSHKLEQQLFYL